MDLSFIRLWEGRGVRSKRLRNADLNLHTDLLLNCLQIAFSAGRDFLGNFPSADILEHRRKPDTIFPMQSAAFFFSRAGSQDGQLVTFQLSTWRSLTRAPIFGEAVCAESLEIILCFTKGSCMNTSHSSDVIASGGNI